LTRCRLFVQGVAPFRAFIQDRVALARKAKAKDGADALKDWGTIDLFYGCRRSSWDFLYKQEWEEYAKELDGKFKMHVALSREENVPKTYVQQLLKDEGDRIGDALVNKKGYAYIWFVFAFPSHRSSLVRLSEVRVFEQW